MPLLHKFFLIMPLSGFNIKDCHPHDISWNVSFFFFFFFPGLKKSLGSSHHGTVEMNPTRNHEVVGSIPGPAQQIKDPAPPRAAM